jgi:uncharacterized SAM-binding protein YcdF (DUF218 family)
LARFVPSVAALLLLSFELVTGRGSAGALAPPAIAVIAASVCCALIATRAERGRTRAIAALVQPIALPLVVASLSLVLGESRVLSRLLEETLAALGVTAFLAVFTSLAHEAPSSEHDERPLAWLGEATTFALCGAGTAVVVPLLHAAA